MERNIDTGRRTKDRIGSLIRKPIVQAVLVITALAQGMTVRASILEGHSRGGAHAIELPAAVVTHEESGLQGAWLERAIRRESELVAAEYRTKGFFLSPRLARQIGEAAAEYQIEPKVAFGLVRAESSFRSAATSAVGAVGLTQLMPRTASWLEPGVTRAQLRDPETNLRLGFKYLRYLLDKYDGNERLALIAYNRGPGTVDSEIKRGHNPDNGYPDFVHGMPNQHQLFTR